MEKSSKARRSRPVITVVVACGLVALASNLATVLTFFRVSVPAKLEQKSIVRAEPARSKSQSPDQVVARGISPVTQHSSGAESPNVNGVRGSVGLLYAPRETGHAGALAAPAVKEPNIARSSVVQISSGDQSPNINKVDGDVKIGYKPATAPTRDND